MSDSNISFSVSELSGTRWAAATTWAPQSRDQKPTGPVNVACSGAFSLFWTFLVHSWYRRGGDANVFIFSLCCFLLWNRKTLSSLKSIIAHYSEIFVCMCLLISSDMKVYICFRGIVPVTTIPSLRSILKSWVVLGLFSQNGASMLRFTTACSDLIMFLLSSAALVLQKKQKFTNSCHLVWHLQATLGAELVDSVSTQRCSCDTFHRGMLSPLKNHVRFAKIRKIMDCDIPSCLTPTSLSRVLLAKKKKRNYISKYVFFYSFFFQCGDKHKGIQAFSPHSLSVVTWRCNQPSFPSNSLCNAVGW